LKPQNGAEENRTGREQRKKEKQNGGKNMEQIINKIRNKSQLFKCFVYVSIDILVVFRGTIIFINKNYEYSYKI